MNSNLRPSMRSGLCANYDIAYSMSFVDFPKQNHLPGQHRVGRGHRGPWRRPSQPHPKETCQTGIETVSNCANNKTKPCITLVEKQDSARGIIIPMLCSKCTEIFDLFYSWEQSNLFDNWTDYSVHTMGMC